MEIENFREVMALCCSRSSSETEMISDSVSLTLKRLRRKKPQQLPHGATGPYTPGGSSAEETVHLSHSRVSRNKGSLELSRPRRYSTPQGGERRTSPNK